MTTCTGKSCSLGKLCGPFVTVCQFVRVLLSLLVLRVGCGIPEHCLSFYCAIPARTSSFEPSYETIVHGF